MYVLSDSECIESHDDIVHAAMIPGQRCWRRGRGGLEEFMYSVT